MRVLLFSFIFAFSVQSFFAQNPFQVIKDGDVNKLEELIKIDSLILSEHTDKGESLLMVAAKSKQPEIIKLLLRYQCDINETTNNGSSVIHFISDINSLELIKEKGGKLDQKNNLGENILHKACLSGEFEIIKHLINNQIIDVNSKTIHNQTALMNAVYENNTEISIYLIENGAYINEFSQLGISPLINAAVNSNMDIVNKLLEYKVKINDSYLNEKGEPQGTALLHAVKNKAKIEMIELLLRYGSNPNVFDEKEITPLMYAASNNDIDFCYFLFKYGATILARDKADKTAVDHATDKKVIKTLNKAFEEETELLEHIKSKMHNDLETKLEKTKYIRAGALAFNPVFSNDIAALNILLEKGADVNSLSWFGSSLLMVATDLEHISIMKLLLEKGADVNTVNLFNETALKYATKKNNTEQVRLLISENTIIDLHGDETWSAIMPAAKAGNLEIVKLLVEAEANINHRILAKDNMSDMDVLSFAAESGNTELVGYLIDKGAVVNRKDTSWTALMTATRNEDINMVKFLIEKGADVDAITFPEGTSLKQAAMKGNLDIVKFLIASGAKINYADNDYWTTLMIAVTNDDLEMAKYLLENGADVDAKMKSKVGNLGMYYDMTAVMLASALGYKDILNLLIESNADLSFVDSHGNTALDLAKNDEIKEIIEAQLKKPE